MSCALSVSSNPCLLQQYRPASERAKELESVVRCPLGGGSYTGTEEREAMAGGLRNKAEFVEPLLIPKWHFRALFVRSSFSVIRVDAPQLLASMTQCFAFDIGNLHSPRRRGATNAFSSI